MTVHAVAPCGCRVEQNPERREPAFVFCRMHDVAPRVLSALEQLLETPEAPGALTEGHWAVRAARKQQEL